MELENIVDNLIAILKELPDWTEISVWELLKTIDDKKYTTKELLFSGAGYGVAPSDGEGYYADTGKFQTLTQQSANKMFYNNSKHYMNRSNGTNYSANIRPVIAIASDSAYILGGSGTKLDPYRLKVVPPVPHRVDSLDDSLQIDDDIDSALFGERVTFTTDKNRKVKKITFTNKTGEPVTIDLTVIDEENGKYAFIMPDHDVYLNVEYEDGAPSNPATFDASGISVLLLASCAIAFGLIIRANSMRKN